MTAPSLTTSPPATGIPTWNLSPDSARRFVGHIQDRCTDTGTRAALRSGLGKSPERAPRMHAILAAWVPDHATSTLERAMYAVAALCARHGPGQDGVNLGACCAAVVDRRGGAGIEHHLLLLTRQSVDGLHRHLPGIIRQLDSLDGPIPDWAGLLRDLADWPTRCDLIGKRWLQAFYRAHHEGADPAARSQDLTTPTASTQTQEHIQ